MVSVFVSIPGMHCKLKRDELRFGGGMMEVKMLEREDGRKR
jgi:hypothetical protein